MDLAAYHYCLTRYAASRTPEMCFYSNRNFSNGKERGGVFACSDKWLGPEESLARKIGLREAARLHGFNPPDTRTLSMKSQDVVRHLKNDPLGVYNTKPCGEEWNWHALACFFNWFWWLNEEGRAQVLRDLDDGQPKWAVWAMHYQSMCPNEVANDPVYDHWHDALFSRSPVQSGQQDDATDPSWDRQGTAPSRPIGPFPQPWPVLRAAPGVPSIPMLPVQPCQPFPQCVVDQAMAAGLPMPCQPFPECAFELARAAAAVDPATETTVAPDGRGTYQAASDKKDKSPSWLLPVLIGALGLGVVGIAVMVSSPGYDMNPIRRG